MVALKDFPAISQLDGDINEQWDCVPTAIAASLQWLTGRAYHGGPIKDMVYGTAYQGGTAAIAYVDYCARQGVLLKPIEGTPSALVFSALQELVNGHPVLFTEIDPYSAAIGASHVVVAYQSDHATITVMDPYIGSPVSRTYMEWANVLQFNEVWSLSRIEEAPMVHINATDDDFHVWGLVVKKAPLIDTHGIPQSWLQARWARGLNFGSPLEPEYAIKRGNVTCMEQQFTAARAQWHPDTNKVTWWLASGSIEI